MTCQHIDKNLKLPRHVNTLIKKWAPLAILQRQEEKEEDQKDLKIKIMYRIDAAQLSNIMFDVANKNYQVKNFVDIISQKIDVTHILNLGFNAVNKK